MNETKCTFIPIAILLLCIIATFFFGIYSDHICKMKKLELIEKGIVKSYHAEMLDKVR